MIFKFRVWMPLVAVLIVLLSIVTLLLYVLPASKSRLAVYVEDRAVARAAATAAAVSDADGEDLRRGLDLAADSGGGQVLVVDRQGRIVGRAGPRLLAPPPREVLLTAAEGGRYNDVVGEYRVAVVPVVREGSLDGGVVFVAGEAENVVYRLFLRSGIEAAAVASVLGGGLALLLATLLGRRVERIALGARAMGGGDLSSRIEPGSDDELGELARTLNGMAERLEDSFLQLKESGATLNTILDNLTEGVLATDPEGRIVFANLAARSMLDLGHGEGPLGDMPAPWKDFDLPGAVARCANGGQCSEARVRNGDNFMRVTLERLPKFDKRDGVLVVIQDLSEGRRLEANQQRFLANAAHELKTPITTILGAAELLLTEEEDDPAVRRRFLSHIYSEAGRMRRLSETLLRLARTGYDLQEPDLRVLDLDGAAREAAERMEPLADSAGVTLAVEGRGGRVRADHEWLEQALLVLLNNAVQHSKRGGEVRVRVEAGAVTVEDDGTGISEEDLRMVFERFYRGRGNAEKGGGAGGSFGLGLAICKELVERMSGSISLESEEGVGTKVKIELPEVNG